MKKIGIFINPHKPHAQELATKIKEWLVNNKAEVFDNLTLSVDEILSKVELVICLGGDGTILSVADQMIQSSVPILGVNMGSVGFLTEVKEEEIFEELEIYFKGKSLIEERLMLSCALKNAQQEMIKNFLVLNDIVISREGLSRILYVEVMVGEEKLTRFTGDGVIIATPTGSTAYSLSAGGSVVHPKLHAMVITPICPHASALRSMVVSGDEKISVKIWSKWDLSKAVLSADGQENVEIDDSYTVEITRSKTPLKLIKSTQRSYFATLREKFKFPE